MGHLTIQEIHSLIHYDPDTGSLTWRERGDPVWDRRYAGKETLTTLHRGIRRGLINDKWYHAHHVAYALMEGKWPPKSGQVYFRDGDPENLKWVNIAAGSRTDALSVGREIPSSVEMNSSGTLYRCRYYVNGHKFTSSFKKHWREAVTEADGRKAAQEPLLQEHGLAYNYCRSGDVKFRVWLRDGGLSRERFESFDQAIEWRDEHEELSLVRSAEDA